MRERRLAFLQVALKPADSDPRQTLRFLARDKDGWARALRPGWFGQAHAQASRWSWGVWNAGPCGCLRTRSGGAPTTAETTSTSRPSSSTALSARTASSGAPDPRACVGLQLDLAPMRRSLAVARGEARPVASARLGSGRSRFAALRRRIRLEARVRAKAAIRPHDSVRKSFPTSLWKLWKTPIVEPQAHAGFRAARSGDFTTPWRMWGHPNGGRPEKISERARTSRAPSKRVSPPRRSYPAPLATS